VLACLLLCLSVLHVQNVSNSWTDVREAFNVVLTDFGFKCAQERIARAVVENSTSPTSPTPAYVYRYHDNVSFSDMLAPYGLPSACINRSCHDIDVRPRRRRRRRRWC
jgi:hypothetical protein